MRHVNMVTRIYIKEGVEVFVMIEINLRNFMSCIMFKERNIFKLFLPSMNFNGECSCADVVISVPPYFFLYSVVLFTLLSLTLLISSRKLSIIYFITSVIVTNRRTITLNIIITLQ